MSSPSDREGYRPDIDGLRTIAVGSVLLYHYGLTAIPGGFVGVDVFFVISGYLITNILARDISSGGFSVTSFYNRRIRRILPAVLFVLIVCLGAGWLLLAPGDYDVLGHSAAYSAFGAANLYFYWNTGYFDQAAELMPLLHLWSLGVEEQFYVVWPLLLAAIMWVARGKAWVTVAAILIVIAVSFAGTLLTMPVDPKGAFFLPHLRAWELAVGALIAFLPAIRWRIVAELMGVAGLALIAYSLIMLKAGDPFPGINALAPVLGTALLMWPRANSVTSWILSLPPMVFTGKISYSLYLWHWPVLVFFRFWANGELPTPMEAAILGVVAYALAVFSWWVVERPFRRIKAKSTPVIVSGIAAIAATAAAGFIVVQQAGFTSRISPQAQELSNLRTMWAWNCPANVNLNGNNYCAFGAPWTTASIRAMVWGDSHAGHMSPPLAAIAESHNAFGFLHSECAPIVNGLTVAEAHPMQPKRTEECVDFHRQGMEILRKHPEINLVVLAASWGYNMRRWRRPGSDVPEDTPRGMGVQLLWDGLEAFIAEAAGPDRRFAIIADVPQWRRDPTLCAVPEVSSLPRRPCTNSELSHPREQFESLQGDAYAMFREFAAAHPDVQVIYPADHMCSAESCISKLNDVFLYRDRGHIRRNMTVEANRAFAEFIQLGDVFKSFISRPAAVQTTALVEVDTSRLVTRRQNDLLALKAAIDAYYLETGAYPPAYDGLKGIHDRGAAWIPELAPKYIAALPRDPALSDSPDGPRYLYVSDKKGYKLIAVKGTTGHCGADVERDGIKIDPARTNEAGCWAFGFWTEGFAKF